jgi:hypothetical protein
MYSYLSTNDLKVYVFPDEHASSIPSLVNLEGCNVWNEKPWLTFVYTNTHSISLLDLLPNGIWNALMKTSYFFRDICSNKLETQYMERLEMNIVYTICKLRMTFPPSFFNSIEHLSLHLSFEAKVEGLVQYRWMYLFEMLGLHIHHN